MINTYKYIENTVWVLPFPGSKKHQPRLMHICIVCLLHTLILASATVLGAKVETGPRPSGEEQTSFPSVVWFAWAPAPIPPSVSPWDMLTAGATCHTWVAPGCCALMQKFCGQIPPNPRALAFGSATPEGLYFSAVFQAPCGVNGASVPVELLLSRAVNSDRWVRLPGPQCSYH